MASSLHDVMVTTSKVSNDVGVKYDNSTVMSTCIKTLSYLYIFKNIVLLVHVHKAIDTT